MLIRKYFTVITISIMFICQNLFAQIIVQGVVQDNGSEPVENALVELIDQADTNRVFSSVTDALGQYSIQITQTGISDGAVQKPGAFYLLQNYPNPFNPSTVISYEVPRPAYIRIEIYNVLGQKIKTLFDGFQTSLYDRVVWDATNDLGQGVSAGVYIYSLTADGIRANRKMLLLDGHLGKTGAAGTVYSGQAVLSKYAANLYRLRISGTDIETFLQQDLQITANRTLDVSVIRIVTDIDGNVYRTVKIGGQWWLAQDLRKTRYRNGDAIPNITDNTEWMNLTTGAYCYYDNNIANAELYGALYNWYAVNDSRNIAPAGWHVPTDAEWQTLVDFLGGYEIAGSKIKAVGTDYWCLPNEGSTNESGFTAMPGGYLSHNGYFAGLGVYALYWSATERDSSTAWEHELFCNSLAIGREHYIKQSGLTVRLVRDSGTPNNIPAPLSPENGITGVSTSPTLSWSVVAGATSYGLQFTTDNSFSVIIVDQSGLVNTSYPLTGLAAGTTCYWRVNATNAEGTSNWSEVWSFTTTAANAGTVTDIDGDVY